MVGVKKVICIYAKTRDYLCGRGYGATDWQIDYYEKSG
jgi:hypothetical protein